MKLVRLSVDLNVGLRENAARNRVGSRRCDLDAASPRIARQFLRMGGRSFTAGKCMPHGWIFRGIADIIEKRSATKITVSLRSKFHTISGVAA